MFRKEFIERMAQVEYEYRAANHATAFIERGCSTNPLILEDIRRGDLKMCRENLEDTYIVRLFAVFEDGLRFYWMRSFGRTTHPKTKDLVNGCASRQHVPFDPIENVHGVRDYRNSIVHGGDADRVTLGEARVKLCTFFGFMPSQV